MGTLFKPSFALTLFISFLYSQTCDAARFTIDDKNEVLRIHNLERSKNLQWPATDMMEMRWDDQLEARAEKYTSFCDLSRKEEALNYGLNTFSEPTSSPFFFKNMMHLWVKNEKRDSLIATVSTAVPGKEVGKGIHNHYSQMIGAKAYLLGCAYTTCDIGAKERVFACTYYPAGNVVGRGWYTLANGATQSGSNCPRNSQRLENGLCDSSKLADWSPSYREDNNHAETTESSDQTMNVKSHHDQQKEVTSPGTLPHHKEEESNDFTSSQSSQASAQSHSKVINSRPTKTDKQSNNTKSASNRKKRLPKLGFKKGSPLTFSFQLDDA